MKRSANDKTALCSICGSNSGIFYLELNGFNLYSCKRCKLLWVEGISPYKLASFYDHTYFYSDSKMGYDNYLADEKNHRRNAGEIINAISKIRDLEGSKVLDVGCAFGFLLDELNRLKRCEGYGIEISSHAFAYAKNLLGLNVHNCDLSECNFEPESFDIAFLIGTIEHIISPRKTLEEIGKILKPGGLLVLTTVDTMGLIPLYSLKPPEHLFYFNHDNLSKLLKKAGYNTLDRKTNFATYHIYDLFYRVGKFLSVSLLETASDLIKRYFPDLSIKIPTNEMLMIAEKEKPR